MWRLPAWWIYLSWITRWLFRHPRISGSLALWLFMTIKLGSAGWGLIVVITLWIGICISVIWYSRRGSAVGMVETLKAMRTLARFKTRWPKAAESIGFVNKQTKTAPVVRRRRITDSGISGEVMIPLGRSIDDLHKSTDKLRSAFRCRDFIVRESKPGFAFIEARYSDALRETLTLADLALAPKGSLAIGKTAEGTLATVKAHLSVLIVGMSGSGKSSTLWAIIASLIASGEPTRLYVIDPAGGVELDAMERAMDPNSTARFAVHAYTNKASEAEKIIEHAHRAMFARLAEMKEKSIRFHKPTMAEPRRIILIDEFLLLDIAKKGSNSKLGEILTIGRKAGVTVIALSQAGTVDELGATRRLFPQRICLRVESYTQTNAVLGDGAENSGASCSHIPESTPGVGYMVQEGQSGYTKFRSFLVSDGEAFELSQGNSPSSLSHIGPVNIEDQKTWLYRWFDSEGNLLYVGISNDTTRRTLEHFDTKPWAELVAKWTREPFDNRALADAAETAAIQTEGPIYNIAKKIGRKRVDKVA